MVTKYGEETVYTKKYLKFVQKCNGWENLTLTEVEEKHRCHVNWLNNYNQKQIKKMKKIINKMILDGTLI